MIWSSTLISVPRTFAKCKGILGCEYRVSMFEYSFGNLVGLFHPNASTFYLFTVQEPNVYFWSLIVPDITIEFDDINRILLLFAEFRIQSQFYQISVYYIYGTKVIVSCCIDCYHYCTSITRLTCEKLPFKE